MQHQPSPKPCVHVVDDEELLAELTHRVLRRSYSVTMNVDPAVALEQLLAAERVDVVVTDLMMSPLTGLELHERALAAKPGLAGRFVFMTGGATTEAGKKFLEALPHARLLLKPFSPADLERAVRAVIDAEGTAAATSTR